MTCAERYFLARDDDSHWYLVNAANRKEWYEWLNQLDDEGNYDVPSFARRINGPSMITFEDPQDYKKS